MLYNRSQEGNRKIMDNKIIGTIIKRFRESKGLSQEVLSGLADVDRSHLSKVESGWRSPSITVLYKLAAALDIQASDILKAAETESAKQSETTYNKV
jgi:transcriptional regulator with XRE-family HTH domain